MKIAIDVSQTVYGGGVAVYTRNLVETLLSIDKKNHYRFFFSSLRRNFRDAKIKIGEKNLEVKIFKIPATALDFFWNGLHIWPVEKFVGEVDIFHASDWTQPPAKKAKLVTTIHDLSFLKYPKTVHPKVLVVQKRRLQWVKKQTDQIIAVSEATKKEAIELLGIPAKKITVVYEALPKDVLNFASQLPVKRGFVNDCKSKFKITKPYIFAYGSRAPRKNIEKLIQAFNLVAKKIDCQLVVCGNYKTKEKLPKNVVLTGFLRRNEMLTLFSKAKVFAYPSLYEGFGLPILEAFAFGIPVVTGNCSSMAEISGKAAFLVNPKSVKSIAAGLTTALAGGKPCQEAIELGKKRLKLFSWEKAAKETLQVYKKALAGK
ncbi:MAG: glycosyltransferase family 1 protein [Patescibacteria group bacterium]